MTIETGERPTVRTSRTRTSGTPGTFGTFGTLGTLGTLGTSYNSKDVRLSDPRGRRTRSAAWSLPTQAAPGDRGPADSRAQCVPVTGASRNPRDHRRAAGGAGSGPAGVPAEGVEAAARGGRRSASSGFRGRGVSPGL